MARKKAAEIEAEDAVESSEPRVYEVSFHLDPELSESDVTRAYDAIRAVAERTGAIVAEGTPEKVQLAYTVSRSDNSGRRDYDAAYFAWVAYEGASECHEAVVEAVKTENRVIRFLDIRTTKDAAKHAAEMREMRDKIPEPASEAVSDTELDAALETAAQ